MMKIECWRKTLSAAAHYSTSRGWQSFLPIRPYRPPPDLSLHDKDFKFNPYEPELLKLAMGPYKNRTLIASYDWPATMFQFGARVEQIKAVGNTARFHGLWPNGASIFSGASFWDLYADFDAVFDHYEGEVDKYWPCMVGGSNQTWVYDEWYKHGFPFAYRADMYLHHGLAMRAMVHDSFGFRVGSELSRADVVSTSQQLMQTLTLFGESLMNPQGTTGYPQFPVVPNPFVPLRQIRNNKTPFALRGMRLPMEIALLHGKPRYVGIGVPESEILKIEGHFRMNIKPDSTFIFEDAGRI